MMGASRRRVLARSAALWCGVSAAAVAVALEALPLLVPASGPALAPAPAAVAPAGFADLLVRGCAAASLLAAGWGWALTTEVVVRVLAAGTGAPVVVRRPRGARLLLLAACGVVALGGPAAAAGPGHHDDRPGFAARELAGLPLPDRATSEAREHPEHRQHLPAALHHVRPGDTLWAIAAERLGPQAAVGDVATYCRRIHDRNAALIGADPDLILPGQVLVLPPPG